MSRKNPLLTITLYSGDRKRSPLYLLPHVRSPALAWLAAPPYCLLKYPAAVISKWKSRLNLRLHGRSFGSDRYSEYFPLKQDFSVSLPLRLSGRQCLEYIITLASKIPLCAAEKLLRLIHTFIFRRDQYEAFVRLVVEEYFWLRNSWFRKDLWRSLLWKNSKSPTPQ